MLNFVLLCACGRWGLTIGGATEPTCHNQFSPDVMYIPNLVSFGVCSGPQNCSQSGEKYNNTNK